MLYSQRHLRTGRTAAAAAVSVEHIKHIEQLLHKLLKANFLGGAYLSF